MSEENKEIEIDKVKAQRIMIKIIQTEAANLKTKQFSDMAMVKAIQKIIEEEVQCF